MSVSFRDTGAHGPLFLLIMGPEHRSVIIFHLLDLQA